MAGLYKSSDACVALNESSVVDTNGVQNFTCTYAKPADVPAKITFRSLTAADCESWSLFWGSAPANHLRQSSGALINALPMTMEP